MDFVEKFLNAMERDGIYIDGQIDWSCRDFQRFSVKNKYSRKKPLFVIMNGLGGSYGDWRDPSTVKTIWERPFRDLSLEEKHAQDDHTNKLKTQKAAIRSDAIYRSHILLNSKYTERCVDENKYCKLKRIKALYCYQIRSYLIIPIFDIDKQLVSLQYIWPDGKKRFKKNATPKGGMLILGEKIEETDVIRICEGYATGCSIYEAVGAVVVVTFGASNLEEVATSIRIKYPRNKIVICADNDSHLKNNIGYHTGLYVAKKVNALLVFPLFDEKYHSLKLSDFNDLMSIGGVEEVEKQINRIFK